MVEGEGGKKEEIHFSLAVKARMSVKY